MDFIDKLRAKPAVQKAEKFFPAVAFLAGFSWDSITLGQKIDQSDLAFLLAYYVGAFILVVLLSAHLEHPEGWTKERLQAAKTATPRKPPVQPAAPPRPPVQPAAAAKPAAQPPRPGSFAASAKFSAVAGKMANMAKPATTVVASKIKNVADASATKLKSAADASTAEAKKLADKIGYESTAVPKNAIVVHHRFLDREWSEAWKSRFTWMMQFCFGSMYSALETAVKIDDT